MTSDKRGHLEFRVDFKKSIYWKLTPGGIQRNSQLWPIQLFAFVIYLSFFQAKIRGVSDWYDSIFVAWIKSNK